MRRAWVNKFVQSHQLRRDKGLPARMLLRQPVRHCPPSTGVQAHAHVAGEHFNVFGVWVDLAGRLDTALPSHHTIRARENAGRRHSGRCRQVKIRALNLRFATTGKLVHPPSVG